MLAKLGSPLTIIATLFLILCSLSTLRSCHLYREGSDALSEQKYLKAITFFERSGLYYAPLNPFHEMSVIALLSIENAKELKESGFPAQAGKAAVRVLNQTSPWGKTGARKVNFSQRTFPRQSFTTYTLTHLSFWGWITFTILFFFRGFDKTGSFLKKPGIATLLTSLFSLGVWLFLIRYF